MSNGSTVAGDAPAIALPWYKVAFAAALVHLAAVGVSRLAASWLGLFLLAPGFLMLELFDQPRPRNGYNVPVIGTSTLFFAALGVLYSARPKLAMVVGGVAVLAGLAVMLGHIVRALGGP